LKQVGHIRGLTEVKLRIIDRNKRLGKAALNDDVLAMNFPEVAQECLNWQLVIGWQVGAAKPFFKR
jgi:hypothetical protein